MPKEGTTRISIELEIAAQNVIHNFLIHNNEIENQIKAGVEAAIKSFDFETEVARRCHSISNKEIRDAKSWDNVRKMVQMKADKIVDDYIEKELKKMNL